MKNLELLNTVTNGNSGQVSKSGTERTDRETGENYQTPKKEVKTQQEIQQIKDEISKKKQWVFELANCNEYLDEEVIETFSKPLIKYLKKQFLTFFDEEKTEKYKDWTKEKKDLCYFEYTQLKQIIMFCRLVLFSRAYDLLDNRMYDIYWYHQRPR